MVAEKPQGTHPEKLAAACKRLLENHSIPPLFDAILIDEGQDLAVGQDWKYEDKEAIYWLAWQTLRPITPEQPNLRRLIWAYDEAQTLDALGIPQYGQLFGQTLGAYLSGHQTGPTYPGGVNKSEVLRKCYRTPGPILTAAHGIGMGLLRYGGPISGFTTQTDWRNIGYEVLQGTFRGGQTVTLHRPPSHSPNPLPQLWSDPLIEFEVFADRPSQLEALTQRIHRNLHTEQLNPSRDILIVIIGAPIATEPLEKECASSNQLQRQIAHTLCKTGINTYQPGARAINQSPQRDAPGGHSLDQDRFWTDGAVTVSQIYRAKGHEAPLVYVVGIEAVAQDESNLRLRNQLFVALTRSMGWVHISGIQSVTGDDYLLYDELRDVIAAGDTFKFRFHRPPARLLNETQRQTL